MWQAFLAGAALDYLGSQNAADAQESAAAAGRSQSDRQYQQGRSDLTPWRAGGANANQNLLALLGVNSIDRENFRTKLLRPATAGTPQEGYWGAGSGNYKAATPGTPAEYGIDEDAYQAALSQRQNDPRFGSLLKEFTGADLQNEPGYQFGLEEGREGIDQLARRRGMYNSGATLKALTRFNQDYAGTKFQDAYNRDQSNRNNIYSMLSGVSNTGANAAGQTANLGANNAGLNAGLLSQAGDARAAGIIGGTNAITGGINNYLNYQQGNKVLDYLKNNNWSSATKQGGYFP